MIKPSLVISALLLASVSVAHAETAPNTQGAASVQKNLDANKSDGRADKGLNNAEQRITANRERTEEKAEKRKEERREERREERKEDRKEARAEKHEHHEHHEHAERPARPERPGK